MSDEDNNVTYFHYTSLEGFLAIAQSRCLRASDLMYLNDPREIHLGSNALGDFLEKLGFIPSSEHQNHLNALREKYQALKDDIGIFGVSTSLVRDALPQWLEYGDRGRGVCIGFRPRLFGLSESPIIHLKVSYSETQFSQKLEELFSSSQRNWLAAKEKALSNDELEAIVFNDVIGMLLACASYKHASWDHEQEMRLGLISYKFGKAERTTYAVPDSVRKKLKLEEVNFRVRSGSIIPYVDIPLDRIENDGQGNDIVYSITEIVLGPANTVPCDAIGAVLSRYDIYVEKISQSECKVR